MSCPVPTNREPGQACGGREVGICVSGKCECQSGYTNDDCSSCDPAFFSVKVPQWGGGSFKCSITDSKTSFIGVQPTPYSTIEFTEDGSSSFEFKTLLNPVYIGAVAAFLLLVGLALLGVCLIGRINRRPKNRYAGERIHMLAAPVRIPDDDSHSQSHSDSESMMSMGTPPADSGGLHDTFSLAQSTRGYKYTGGGAAPARSDSRSPLPRSDTMGTSGARIPRGFDRPSDGPRRPKHNRNGSANTRYSGGYEMGFM